MFYLVKRVFDIRTKSDPDRAIREISDGVSIAGYNMWLLFCSAAIASIGLDTNSTAVIIGAMLISPLMSPILGIGLSLGIHDRQLLFRSSKNLVIAVILSLAASILYFLISPFASPTAEIEARTYPTALDIMVAFFGGIAGIVSASRSGQSNALPGVAIATALMPPLCTAGYGIATLQWNYFVGAFYLFSINAVFISLATFLIAKYLRFPARVYRTGRQQALSNAVFTLLAIIVTIPSIYFLYSVYERETVRKKINSIVIREIEAGGNEIIKWEIENLDSVKAINVYYTGGGLSDSFRRVMQENLTESGIKDHKLVIRRMNMSKEEINELSAGAIRNMFQEMELQQNQKKRSSAGNSVQETEQIMRECKIAFPFLDSAFIGWTYICDSTGVVDTIPLFIYKSKGDTSGQIVRLNKYLKTRLTLDTIVTIRQ